jgi:hypothetical protein
MQRTKKDPFTLGFVFNRHRLLPKTVGNGLPGLPLEFEARHALLQLLR